MTTVVVTRAARRTPIYLTRMTVDNVSIALWYMTCARKRCTGRNLGFLGGEGASLPRYAQG